MFFGLPGAHRFPFLFFVNYLFDRNSWLYTRQLLGLSACTLRTYRYSKGITGVVNKGESFAPNFHTRLQRSVMCVPTALTSDIEES